MCAAKKNRAVLNTTIGEEALSNYKDYCKNLGLPMNVPLEAFMMQFASGEFIFKLGKSAKMEVDLED